jgi:divalent metal cation (Fe/Co/Zn/Cd) transporter
MPLTAAAPNREALVRHALRLEYLTVGWNVVEGVIAVAAALAAGSVALLGFGVDSFVETASGLVLVWRLGAERGGMEPQAVDQLDRRAHRLVGASLFLLAAFVAVDAVHVLWARERPSPSAIGVALTAISIVVMRLLARAKRRAAARLGSRALEADAFQTTACFWLSVITLAGIGLNAALGWWWADPVAALGMASFIAKEGREAWCGEACGCEGEVAALVRDPPAAAATSCGCAAGACSTVARAESPTRGVAHGGPR